MCQQQTAAPHCRSCRHSARTILAAAAAAELGGEAEDEAADVKRKCKDQHWPAALGDLAKKLALHGCGGSSGKRGGSARAVSAIGYWCFFCCCCRLQAGSRLLPARAAARIIPAAAMLLHQAAARTWRPERQSEGVDVQVGLLLLLHAGCRGRA